MYISQCECRYSGLPFLGADDAPALLHPGAEILTDEPADRAATCRCGVRIAHARHVSQQGRHFVLAFQQVAHCQVKLPRRASINVEKRQL
jgi:hypothetical protein